jgi:citronellol/citronellal dehydrogenase
MHGVNGRGTFVCAQACLPHLLNSANPHILTLSPPLVQNAKWFSDFPAYTIAKYTMSLFTLALAGEFKNRGVAVNSLWPRTAIATAAVRNEIGGAQMIAACRKPEIVADAAHYILTRPANECSGNFFLDDEVLLAAGVRDFAQYDVQAGAALQADFFVEALPGMLPSDNMTKRIKPS